MTANLFFTYEATIYDLGGWTERIEYDCTPTGKYNFVTTNREVNIWIEITYTRRKQMSMSGKRNIFHRLFCVYPCKYEFEDVEVTTYVPIDRIGVRMVEHRTFNVDKELK